MNILGVRVDNLEKKEILNKISLFLSDDKFHPAPILNREIIDIQNRKKSSDNKSNQSLDKNWYGTSQIATINPEIILKAQEDKEFRNILNNCELNLADSIGIKFAFWRRGEKLKCRLPGIDLMRQLLKIANEKKIKVFLVANRNGLSSWEETRNAIKKIYPELEINGVNLDKNDAEYKIPDTKYQILFCNFGAPFQEKFLNSLKNDIIGIAVGVGGSFDYITGKVRRAPLFMRQIGLEWLFRFWQQPKRIKRIFNAVLIFPTKLMF